MIHANFFELIAQNVRILCSDILCLEKGLVHLDTGEKISSDAILCGTGWIPSLQFFSREQLIEFGLAYPLSDEPAVVQKSWAKLQAAADQKVLSSFPQLAKAPPHLPQTRHASPLQTLQAHCSFLRHRCDPLHRLYRPNLCRQLLRRRGGAEFMAHCLSRRQASTPGGRRKEARRSGALHGVVQTQVF